MIFCKMCKHIATWMALLLVQLLPLTADAKKLQKTLDKEAKKLQARAGIQGEQQADLQLYQGNKEGFRNSPLKSYKAA